RQIRRSQAMRKKPCPKLFLNRESIVLLEATVLREAGGGLQTQACPTRPVTCMTCITCNC
ncbi:MAG TPA: hypothetical protein VN999_16645, partial [Thermoanaerobaculia bacterium]|nr:hypothetical protein [Thermoanaerobaculia bacterium]